MKEKNIELAGSFKDILISLAEMYGFFKEVLQAIFLPPYEIKESARQFFKVGYKSLFLISFTGLVAGVVFTQQSRPSLQEFGAESWLPSLVAIAIIRSLGPLITALIFSGKVGSNIGAELGSMNVTEQIDAMEVSGTFPMKYLVASRVIATTLMVPVLTIYTDALALLGSFVEINMYSGTSFKLFVINAFSSISFLDIFASLGKTFIFGFAIGITSCYYGYHASSGTEGVGKAANSAVIVSMLLVFIIDLVSVQIINLFR